MGSIIKITRLHFLSAFNGQIITCFANLLLNLVISIIALRVADGHRAGVCDFLALGWIFFIGLIFFIPVFRYTLSLGISRRTYFIAGSLGIFLLAAVMAVIVLLYQVINQRVAGMWMLYELIYPDQGLLGLLVWEFTSLLFLGMLGWLIRLIYYLSNRPVKFIISSAPFVIFLLLLLFNILLDGVIGRALLDFIKSFMGISGVTPNPYIGTGSMLAAAVILTAPVFLLMRRIQVYE